MSASPPPEALAELKSWLRIARDSEDATLALALAVALDMAEAVTRRTLLARAVEEQLPASSEWQRIAAFPILAVTGVTGLTAEGDVVLFTPERYRVDIDADGAGRIRLAPTACNRVTVTMRVGTAETWASLPPAIAAGVIRQAAALYAERSPGASEPVASALGLWRAWRRVGL